MTKAKQTTSGANIQKAGQQNAQFGTEFASETNVAEVKQANAQSEAKKQQSVGQQNAQFGTEFASETNVAEVRKANAQSAAKKQ